MVRRFVIVAGAAVFLLALVVVATWLVAAGRVEGRVAAWTEREQAAGIVFTHGAIAVAGFPFTLAIAIDTPQIATADGRRRWEAPRLTAEAPLWDLHRFRYQASGRHRYRFIGPHDTPHDIVFDMVSAAGTLGLAPDDAVRRLDLDAGTVRITGSDPGEIALEALQVRFASAPEQASDLKSDSASLVVGAQSVALIGDANFTLLTQPIDRLDLALAVTGPLPWEGGDGAIRRWRDAGGTVELHSLALRWGDFAVAGEGTGALDDRMRPMGAFSFRLDGLDPTLAALVDQGRMSGDDATQVRSLADGLTSADPAVPGRRILTVSVEGGALKVGTLTLGRLEPFTIP
jgi:Uncharacterized protein conserved in bacteria (DUF2125)